MRFTHGQLQVTCCNCHVIMCSCDIRHSSADCWLLSAGLQTDSSWRIGFGAPANIVIFYIEYKFRATTLHVLKACRRSGGIAPPTFQLSVRWRWVISLPLMPFCTRWCRTGGWLDRQPGRTVWRREKCLYQPEIDFRNRTAPRTSNKCKHFSSLFCVCFAVNKPRGL